MNKNQIIPIKDLCVDELALYRCQSEVQLLRYKEPLPGYFIAESPLVIGRALDAGYKPISMLVEKQQLNNAATKEIIDRCPEISVYTAPDSVLRELTGYALTRGMLCLMQRKPLQSLEEICRNNNRIVILEEVVNPTNVGAIFRSAAALHMDAILLTGGCSNPLYRRALRVSMGNVFMIPWTYMEKGKETWTKEGMDCLHALGYKTAAMALREDTYDIDSPVLANEEKLAIILGTEGEGLKQETIDMCDYRIKIPMTEGVDSLNVAAASAVAFWQLRKNK